MVYIFNNHRHSASTFLDGIEAILPGDIFFLRDQTDRDRVFYLNGIGGDSFLSGIDIATDTWFGFRGKSIDNGWNWAGGGHGIIDIPSIKEWLVLHESAIPLREEYLKGLYYQVITTERFMKQHDDVKGRDERARLWDTIFKKVCELSMSGELPFSEGK